MAKQLDKQLVYGFFIGALLVFFFFVVPRHAPVVAQEIVEAFTSSPPATCPTQLARNTTTGRIEAQDSTGRVVQDYATLEDYASARRRNPADACPILSLQEPTPRKTVDGRMRMARLPERVPFLDDYEFNVVLAHDVDDETLRTKAYRDYTTDWAQLPESSEIRWSMETTWAAEKGGADAGADADAKRVDQSLTFHDAVASGDMARGATEQETLQAIMTKNAIRVAQKKREPQPGDKDWQHPEELSLKQVSEYMNTKDPDAPYWYKMRRTGPNQFEVAEIAPKKDYSTNPYVQ